jgi:hypothetical protein
MSFLLITAALTLQQASLTTIPWGTKLDEVAAANRRQPVANEPPDREGLIHGADFTAEGPGGTQLPVALYFTPLSRELARIEVHPAKSICEPLLPELRHDYGEGVDLTEFAEIRHWQFSDFQTNTRWDFYTSYSSKDRVLQSCSIIGHTLVGTQFSR